MIDLPTLQVIGWVIVGASLLSFALTSGFDSGIGILLPFIGRNDTERRLTLNVIGPTWDGNQVWLIAAGVPYLLFGHWSIARLFWLLCCNAIDSLVIIFTSVGFEYRSKLPNQTWRNNWILAFLLQASFPF
ncbi:Cytochrome d ubiquinol oxidase subunit 2 [Piscirickettsia salmonis]|uniref:cytochrome d ubiquinol oxidase subunit II n=1 Tax=Piscirickettsia salmonis TaxID=1238 RepID=UPI001E2DD6C2|nr:cytochrome d ubiquinol oxidase subunit II [Piscirickettsia salmonis]QGP35806.1 Cytochrome d ubiquinol oxidase subunit 2 [Piscirickettsia salmonis]